MAIVKNKEFLLLFEGTMTNPNGDPDQENRPRMDYETSTLLVSDARRKRDIRDFLKEKGYPIFVDSISEKKVTMDTMFAKIIEDFLSSEEKVKEILKDEKMKEYWILGDDPSKYFEKYVELKNGGGKKSSKKKGSDNKVDIGDFNNMVFTEIVKKSLVDIRLFGSAMAVENHSKTYTGPVQIAWGYSLHPCELVKSNTITSIMNEDSSTFGKKYQVEYALVAHYGTVNKFAARRTGMSESDMDLFRKSLVQGIMNNQTTSKSGQNPLMYIEVEYAEDFDGYIGDLRRFIDVEHGKKIKAIKDIKLDFSRVSKVIEDLRKKGYVESVRVWMHPYIEGENITGLLEAENVDLWKGIEQYQEEK